MASLLVQTYRGIVSQEASVEESLQSYIARLRVWADNLRPFGKLENRLQQAPPLRISTQGLLLKFKSSLSICEQS